MYMTEKKFNADREAVTMYVKSDPKDPTYSVRVIREAAQDAIEVETAVQERNH